MTHLTFPSLRDGPLPLPLEGRRGAYSPDVIPLSAPGAEKAG